jgi:hypothetical protein
VQRLLSAFGALLAIAIVVVAVGGLVYGVIEDPAVVGPLAAAAVVIAAGLLQRRWEKSRELEKLHRDEIAPIYEQLVETVKSIDTFAEKPQEEQEAFFRQLSTTLLLHGPSPVVRTWVAWLRRLDQPLAVSLPAQEQLLRAIRDDLGLNNAALLPGDLIRLYLLEEDSDESRELWRQLTSGK